MKKLFSLIIVCLPVLFFSCQKEFLSDQQVSIGTLTKDANGQCSKITVAGTYTAGTGIGDTNYIIVQVNVRSKGSYLISTDIINGFSFKASGNFSDTGNFKVKLAGTGNPMTSGTNNFIVRYGTSSCNFSINVSGAATVQPAVFTLAGAPDSCMNAIVSGNYLKNITLDTSNKVTIKLNVTSAGTYSIATNTVNGYNFSGSGLIGTGVQNVTLKASGKPLNVGTDVFSVSTASSCTFAVKVLSGVAVINPDHFPLTTNSYWTYDDLWNPGDTLKRTINDSSFTNGSLFKIMNEQLKFGTQKQYLFRKTDSAYYEYTSVDKYTTSVTFLPQIIKEIPFLKENLTTGDVWTTEEYIGPASFGQTIFLRYEFTCDDANAVVTINGNTFANVYKIVMRPQIRSATTYPYNTTGERRDIYYAKGVGIIYTKFTVQTFTQLEWQIKNWLVK